MEDYLKKIDIKALNGWLNDPTYNPLSGLNDVTLSLKEDSDYVMLYNKAFELLRKNGMKTHNILKKLPNNHLLFNNKIDYLYVFYNLNNKEYPYEGKDKKYLLYKNYNMNTDMNIIFDKLSYIVDFRDDIKPDKYEKILIEACYEYLLSCINYIISIIRNRIFNNYTLEKLETEFLTDLKYKIYELNDIVNFFNFIGYKFEDKQYKIDDSIITTNAEAIYISMDVFRLIDYKDSGKDIIEIIKEKKFETIEDPLLKLLSKKEFENIDKDNLELPTQNMTDKQFKSVTEEYNKLEDEFNNAKTMAKTPPKRSVLELPNKTKITIGIHKIPKQNYTDAEYKNLKTAYIKNKPTIDLYKQLINTGFLDLKPTSSSKSIPMLNKSRDEIIRDDLFDDTVIDNSRLSRCINDTDIISQDDFNNPNYPLAKLQLMTKLKIKGADGKLLRTDCYYTPNLYNHLVTLANDKKPFTDPYNGEYLLTDKDINDVMKIMKIIDPKLEKPRYVKNSNDNLFMIDAEINDYNLNSVYVYRLFGNTRFKIKTIFVFPADIEVEDTGSADITSSTLLLKIIELFNNGKLMETYLPPYNIDNFYLLPDIDYNAYNNINKWNTMSRKKKIDLFKRMATEINAI